MIRSRKNRTAGKVKFETLLIVGLVLGWFILQALVLPQLGVST
jgi:hypothetical protein